MQQGPDQDKQEFVIFDYCQNLEFFGENPTMLEPSLSAPIGERLFKARLDLVSEISGDSDDDLALRRSVLERLQAEVAAINPDNFIVRPHREALERFQNNDVWQALSPDDLNVLTRNMIGLPTAFKDDSLSAKQFDLLILRAQLALLKSDPAFLTAQKRIREIASALEAKQTVPLIAKQIDLILELQTDEYWTDITIVMLEEVRRKLRLLVGLIDPRERKPIITDLADEIGIGTRIDMPDVSVGIDKGRFKLKVRQFLEDHAHHITLLKLRRGEQMTPQDLNELERILIEANVADENSLASIRAEGGVGRFLRSLTGLDRAAAKEAFGVLLRDNDLNADQIEFLDLILDSLSENGEIDPSRFFESPFTDIDAMGLAAVFEMSQAEKIVEIVRRLNGAAAA